MRRKLRPAGFTLLEVILALGLTVVVMSAIGVAIFLHLKAVDHTRLATERDQLARILLRRMGDDLRSAVRREPPDDAGMKALATLMQSAKNAGKSGSSGRGAGGGGARGGGASSGSGDGGTGTTTPRSTESTTAASAPGTTQRPQGADEESTESTSETTAGTPAAVAGLYGTAYDLQIDLARVPRPDEFTAAMMNGASAPSDVRTVYYFLANAATGLSPTGESGLMRSEMNRAEALYASENGDLDIFLRTGELMAGEVAAIEFRYFDGLEWFTEWNSQDMNGLPMAVEMAIMLFDPQTADETVLGGSLFDPASGVDQDLVYRTMVRLPSAQIPQATSGGSSTSSDSSSSTSGSSTSGSSTSGTSGGGGS
jgi:uncharacterized membrane protein YgcG